jgi:hypothetical protein
MDRMTMRGVALGVAVLCGSASLMADEAAIGRTQAAAPIVGTWQVVITPYICQTGESLPITFKSRLQFSAGGTMAETPFNPAFQPGQSSGGLGSWGATGRNSYYNVFEAFVNFSDENFTRGVRRVDQVIAMLDDDHWTSSAVVSFTDEEGNAVPPSGCMNATGERMQ